MNMDPAPNAEQADSPETGWFKRLTDLLSYQLKLLRHRPRLMWSRAWIRENEFHRSLDMDIEAMLDMSGEDQKRYLADLVKRRNLAYERKLQRLTRRLP